MVLQGVDLVNSAHEAFYADSPTSFLLPDHDNATTYVPGSVALVSGFKTDVCSAGKLGDGSWESYIGLFPDWIALITFSQEAQKDEGFSHLFGRAIANTQETAVGLLSCRGSKPCKVTVPGGRSCVGCTSQLSSINSLAARCRRDCFLRISAAGLANTARTRSPARRLSPRAFRSFKCHPSPTSVYCGGVRRKARDRCEMATSAVDRPSCVRAALASFAPQDHGPTE
ncbi:hypothetical protein J6590_050117 [Homalodisca vitripennis]|nr:hypothetical protein J6590_050117 [Homalodisca vitripennis]